MLYQVIGGKKTLSEKALWRLEQAEKACGVRNFSTIQAAGEGIKATENLQIKDSAPVKKSVASALVKLRDALNEVIDSLNA